MLYLHLNFFKKILFHIFSIVVLTFGNLKHVESLLIVQIVYPRHKS